MLDILLFYLYSTILILMLRNSVTFRMLPFYVTYNSYKKLQPLVGEISWAKHLVAIELIIDDFKLKYTGMIS